MLKEWCKIVFVGLIGHNKFLFAVKIKEIALVRG